MVAQKTHNNKPHRNKRPAWLRFVLWSLGVLLLVFSLILASITWYVNKNKKHLLAYVSEKLHEQTGGTLIIGNISPTIWKNFPHFSLRLDSVMLYDSLYHQHHRALLNLKYAYLKVDLKSLLSATPNVESVILTEGKIHFFKDVDEYSNLYILKPQNTKTKKPNTSKKEWQIQEVKLEQIIFESDDAPKSKKFEITINKLLAHIKQDAVKWMIDAPVDLKVGQLGFNRNKGAFLENTEIKGDLYLEFDKNSKQFTIIKKPIQANGETINFGAVFRLAEKPITFSLSIDAPKLHFDKANAMLNKHIQSKLNLVNFENTLAVNATIDGRFSYPDTPTVHIKFQTQNNIIVTDYGNLEQASLSGSFYNEVMKGVGHSDHNSEIRLDSLTATYLDIPIRLDSVNVLDLINPFINFNLKSNFEVKKLNDIIGNSIAFTSGNALLDLKYSGPLQAESIANRSLDGDIIINKASLTYLPRQLSSINSDIHLNFSKEDLFIKKILLNIKGNSIEMTGHAKRFLNMYFKSPEKSTIDFNVRSPEINLNNFISFLSNSNTTKKSISSKQSKKRKHKPMQLGNKIHSLLVLGNMNLNVSVAKMHYDKFTAQNVKAKIGLLDNVIKIQQLHLAHAGGTLDINGTLHQSSNTNPFELKVKIKNAKVDKLLYAFNNFGMKSLTDTNIRGVISANVDLKGKVSNDGKVLPATFNGLADFTLTDGALYNFAPLVMVQKFAFKKRNLDSITLGPLQGFFSIANKKVVIEPMNIKTSALHINAKGVYAFENGTDIGLEIPMVNPENNRKRKESGKKEKRGMVVYLRLQDDENGKLKVGWDLLKKGWNKGDVDTELERMEQEEDALGNNSSTAGNAIADSSKTITDKPSKVKVMKQKLFKWWLFKNKNKHKQN